MNRDYHLSKLDMIYIKSELNDKGVGRLKHLSQKERKVLKVAVENFSEGKEAVIPAKIAKKLIAPLKYEKNVFRSFGKAIQKAFKRNYVDSNALSDSFKALNLSVLDQAEKLESKAKKYEERATTIDQEVERLEAEIRRLEAEIENSEGH